MLDKIKTKRIMIRVADDMDSLLCGYANEMQMTKSQVIRRAILDFHIKQGLDNGTIEGEVDIDGTKRYFYS
jgi:predicted transcriptional regulator